MPTPIDDCGLHASGQLHNMDLLHGIKKYFDVWDYTVCGRTR